MRLTLCSNELPCRRNSQYVYLLGRWTIVRLIGVILAMEVACNKGLTSEWASSEGHTDIRQPDGNPCPGGDGFSSIHTTSFADVTGCAIGIVDKANVTDIKPQDFAIFTVNVHCPWTT